MNRLINFEVTSETRSLVSNLIAADLTSYSIDLSDEQLQNYMDNHAGDLIDSIVDAVIQDNQKMTLPSRYKHGDEVKHILVDASKVHKTTILKVHFTESTVTYDIELECYWSDGQTPKPVIDKEDEYYHTRMYNVPSSFLIPMK